MTLSSLWRPSRQAANVARRAAHSFAGDEPLCSGYATDQPQAITPTKLNQRGAYAREQQQTHLPPSLWQRRRRRVGQEFKAGYFFDTTFKRVDKDGDQWGDSSPSRTATCPTSRRLRQMSTLDLPAEGERRDRERHRCRVTNPRMRTQGGHREGTEARRLISLP